jgi:two-component system sensor histidine kinase KdpD
VKKKDDYFKKKVMSIVLISTFLGIATLIGYIFQKLGFSETNIVIVYILFVLLSARLTSGYSYGIISSIASTFAYNYFFTEPNFTFQVNDPGYIITFVIMTITASITSALTSRVKQNAIKIAEKEIETRALYQLTNHLTDAKNIHDIASIATQIISETISCKVGCLCFDEDGIPEKSFVQQVSGERQIYRKVDDVMHVKYRIEELRTAFYSGDKFHDWPIYSQENVLGIIRIPKEISEKLNESQANLLRTMIESTALAMDRFRELHQRLKSKEEIVQERYRGNLLRAISHDLRTPLSGIMGTAEILMDMTAKNEHEYELVSAIYNDADWLRTLVENILNLTRLQEGRLILNKEYEALEEIIGSAINHFSRRSPEFEIMIDMPEKVILIPIDAKLIIQVLINLLDNAMKHSKENNEITIRVKEKDGGKFVEVSVVDNGEGIDTVDLPNVFQMFYTSNCRSADVKHGIGLGLSICETIVHAHGGTIKAENREGAKGAIFSFTLPMEDIS